MSFSDSFRRLFSADSQPRRPADSGAQLSNFDGPFVPPSRPIQPLYPVDKPRSWDYMPGQNLNLIPRAENPEIPSFQALRTAYLSFPILKVMVTFRTAQMLSQSWTLQNKPGSGFLSTKGNKDPRRLIERPDPQNNMDFEMWVRQVLEEVNVSDSLSIMPIKSRNGKVVAWRHIDGSLIKPLIDYQGNVPVPPAPAFMQYVRGAPFTSFTASELYYRPFRPRVWTMYGQSRVESVLMTAVLYQLHENWAADYFTQGNVPEAVLIQDPNVTAKMPEKTHLQWQAIIDRTAGVNPTRRRMHVMPGFVKDVKTLKEFSYQKDLPEWLIRIVCAEFGVPTHLFVTQTNRSTAKEMNEALYDTPLRLEMMSFKRVIDRLLELSDYDVEFMWSKEFSYDKDEVEGFVALTTPGPDGKRVMPIEFAQQRLGIEPGDEESEATDELDTEQETDAPPQEDESSAGDPEDDAEKSLEVRKALGQSKRGRLKRRAFVGDGQKKRTALAERFNQVTLKSLRRQETAILQEALKKARERGKRVSVG